MYVNTRSGCNISNLATRILLVAEQHVIVVTYT